MSPEEFSRFTSTVCNELVSHAEVWVREKKDLAQVAARLEAIDAPPMEVIAGETIARLGRFPAYGETDEHGKRYTLTLRELLQQDIDQSNINIHFLSHVRQRDRHSDSSAEDESSSNKVAMVAGFTNYERETYGKTAYWWIDCVCSDAARSGAHLAALPLYIAASSVVAFYDVGEEERYLSRAWTRLEVLLGAALSSPRSWRIVSQHSFTRDTLIDSEYIVLLNPVEGELSHENERAFVERLTEVARQLWRVGKACNWHSEGNNYSEWNVPEELVPGQTKIFRWNMNEYIFPSETNNDEGHANNANNANGANGTNTGSDTNGADVNQ